MAAAKAPVDIPDLLEEVGDDVEGKFPVGVAGMEEVLEDENTEELEDEIADVVAAAASTRLKIIFEVASLPLVPVVVI